MIDRRAALAIGLIVLSACGRTRDDLFHARLPADAAVARGEVAGYWEGDVSMGPVRLLVEPAAVTLALKCDAGGDRVAQATAPVARASASRLVLRADLAGGDKDCGFRFNEGDALDYAIDARGLEMSFAGASVARLAKLADLPSSSR